MNEALKNNINKQINNKIRAYIRQWPYTRHCLSKITTKLDKNYHYKLWGWLYKAPGPGYSNQFHMEMLRPTSVPPTLSHTKFSGIGTPFKYLSLEKYPFHIPFPEKVPLSHTFL